LLAEWPSVVSVRVSLIARSLQRSVGYTDGKTYNLGTAGTAGPFNDAFRRHLFVSAVRLNNVSGRREIPQ
jgi:type IV pilus assembly protein PilW